ncbi:MAG: hypothetical protein MZV70_67210 [Desulfobacterales bacterium]|nr:hypothetical protein [Desulfobacterales bacterium]
MKLKRLEITGFKSFYERSSIDFPEGITAVVGPQRLRQEQRDRRHPLGDGRAERQTAARQIHGGRDFLGHQRQAAARHGGGVADACPTTTAARRRNSRISPRSTSRAGSTAPGRAPTC